MENHILKDDVVTFGSDGGGGYFCLSRSNGAIYHLPGGMIDKSGVYSGDHLSLRFVSSSFEAFLQRMLIITKEFAVHGSTEGI